MNTPIGIAWRNGFVRCCSDCFDKPYLISEMKRSSNNVEPVVVIDIITKKAKCYLINSAMTDFDIISDPILERRIEVIANYMINKKNIQKSNLSVNEKKLCGEANETKHYNKTKLSIVTKNKFTELMTKGQMVESK